jgi:hypothetical protein
MISGLAIPAFNSKYLPLWKIEISLNEGKVG